MSENKKDSLYIQELEDLVSEPSTPTETTAAAAAVVASSHGANNSNSKSNLHTVNDNRNVKINYLSVPNSDLRFPLHRTNSLANKKKDSSRKIDNQKPKISNQSSSGRKVLEKQSNVQEEATEITNNNHDFSHLNYFNLLSATNSDSKDYSSDDSSDSNSNTNYANKSKKSEPNKRINNNISIVISPLSEDEDDLNDSNLIKTVDADDNNANLMQEKIDLSIFELLDHSSKKFILKPATMGLTIKSQVFRQKGLYPEYKFYLENLTDNLLLVMTARKRKKTKTTCYLINYISYDQTDVEKYIETPIAKLKSNLIGTQFVLYDFGIKPSRIGENKHLLTTSFENVETNISNHENNLTKANSFDTNCSSENCSNDIQFLSSLRKEYLSISYELNFFGYKGPRHMFIIIPGMDNDFNREDFIIRSNSDSLLNSWKKLNTTANKTVNMSEDHSTGASSRKNSLKKRFSVTSQSSKKQNNEDHSNTNNNNSSNSTNKANVVKLVNKSPVWHEQYRSFALNFNGRVTQPSVKNFQIVHEVNPDYIVSQFGKVDTDLYTCDYSYPLCALQAFSIALSSLDNKLGCD